MSSPRIPPAGSPTSRLAEPQAGTTRATSPVAAQPAKATVDVAASAPLSDVASKRASGKVSESERRQLVEVGAAALGRVTDAVRTFHGLDHFTPYNKDQARTVGERPTQLPKVLARVTQELGAIKEAVAHAKPSEAGSPDLAAMMEEFLVIHAAVQRSEVKWNYEREGTYPANLQRLQAKLGEVWALAPAVFGAEEAARLTRRWLLEEPADLTAARSAAGLLDRVVHGYNAPEANGPKGPAVRLAIDLLRDNVGRADFSRDAGTFSVVLGASGMGRVAAGRGKRKVASPDEIVAAARTVLQGAGLDDSVVIRTRHPGNTPARREEAWDLLSEALKARDFVGTPEAGDGGRSLRRWEPTLELEAPDHGTRFTSGGRINLKMFANLRIADPTRPYARDPASDISSDAQAFMARAGFRDVLVIASWAPRPLTEASAQALASKLEALRTTDLPAWKRPAAGDAPADPPRVAHMTPRELLQTFIHKVEVQDGVHGSGRQVVLFADSDRSYYFDQLETLEKAVRALVDDPALHGTPIRIRVDSGTRPSEQHSILFGVLTTEANRMDDAQRLTSPWFTASRARMRREQAEAFAANGAAQASLTTEMLGDPEATAWLDALQANLTAYFLGHGAADPSWQRNLDALPSGERTAFLELALEHLDDPTKSSRAPRPPAVERLTEALGALRRLPGRVELEAATTRNGRTDPTHQAHSDAIFARALGGPALAHATAALAEARAAE